MPKITIDITPEQKEWLDYRKRDLGCPAVETIRRAIEAMRLADAPAKKPARKSA